MKAHAKFCIGALLYNRSTDENGWVKRVYQIGDNVMYEVSIPATSYISDWAESVLELSHNKLSMSSGKPQRDWSYEK